jgi:hypothetical protein
MPVIHHPWLKRELDVSDQQAEILTTVPRLPWKLGQLPTAKPQKPTAASSSPEGDTDPLIEED